MKWRTRDDTGYFWLRNPEVALRNEDLAPHVGLNPPDPPRHYLVLRAELEARNVHFKGLIYKVEILSPVPAVDKNKAVSGAHPRFPMVLGGLAQPPVFDMS
jgi:hypothetical protein